MLNKAQDLMERFGSIATPPNLYSGYGAVADQKAKFPLQLGSTDPDDRKYNIQRTMVGNSLTGTVAGYGQATVGSEFFDYAKRKQDQNTLHDFYGYMLNNADLTKPESAQWWFGKFPWMKDMRLREIEREAEVQKRLAKIQVCGPESEEDFMVLFMIDQGLLKKTNQPLYKLPSAVGIYKQPAAFKAGYFNPFNATKPSAINDVRVNWTDPITNRGTGGLVNAQGVATAAAAAPFTQAGFNMAQTLN